MDARHLDPEIHRILVQALAECVIAKAPVQIPFIADYIDRAGAHSAIPNRRYDIHEVCNHINREWLMNLCEALETNDEYPEVYVPRLVSELNSLFPNPVTMDISDRNIVHHRIKCGSSQFEIVLNTSMFPKELAKLIQSIVYHLNNLQL